MEALPGFLPIPAIFVALLFLYSGIGKLSSQQIFIESLLLVPFLPHQLSSIAGRLIPVTEILIGVLLFWNIGWAKIAAIILLSLFASVALLAVSRNQRVPCNCFGTESSEFLSKATVMRNAALALALVLTLDVPAGAPEMIAINYALVAFVLFLSILKAAKNRRLCRQLNDGTSP